MRALLVEDDAPVGRALESGLARYGIDGSVITSGERALELIRDVDVVILDIGLPDIDGVTVCRRIRQRSDVPIIMVSGRCVRDERIMSLRWGADDYLRKPYNIGELVARINAVRRRCASRLAPPGIVRRGDFSIDLASLTVSVANNPVTLSTKELRLLAMIARERGEVCVREWLLAELWGRPWPGAERSLHVHIATLRAKLGRPDIIQTVRGVGYRLGSEVG